MKTNGTHVFSIVLCVLILQVCIPFASLAQPDYDFSNSSRISGTDRQVGAKYRFTSVKPGVDAIVTIKALTGGLTLNDVDGGSGFKEAFQPVIVLPAHSKGYAEFDVSFVLAGTIIPVIMLEVPITPIDVDGQTYSSGKIYEFDQINWGLGLGSYLDYNMLGGELAYTINPSWVTGTNTAAIDYPGIDTTAKQAMFTVVVPSIPSIMLRVGADNQSGSSQQRLRSIYFKKFTYPNSFLAKPALTAFTGNEKNSKVKLQWQLDESNSLKTIVVEKAASPGQFNAIGELWIDNEGNLQNSFTFNDPEEISGNAYYRLKMIATNNAVTYSNTLVFRTETAASQTFQVYPSVVRSSATVQLKAAGSGKARFQVMDYAGRVVMSQNLQVQEGSNNLLVNTLGALHPGNYVVVVKTAGQQTFSQKIIKQ